MDNVKHNQRKGLKRYSVTLERNCSLGVVTFKNPRAKDYLARIVNISATGIGIASEEGIEPGIIWFKESLYGKKYGVLIWCKLEGLLYRGGIQFIHLTQAEDECFESQISKQPGQAPFDAEGDMVKLIASLQERFGREFNGLGASEPRERRIS